MAEFIMLYKKVLTFEFVKEILTGHQTILLRGTAHYSVN